jgi:hypothetical protein
MSVKQVFNTSAELDYPTVLPTLDLDFANSKTLDPRITFTRASGGSYVGADGLIKLAGVNEPRFDHDPTTGESLGLLIEEQRTNLVSNSTYNASTWSNVFPANATLTTGILAPDGTNTAVRLTCQATGSSLLRVTFPTFTPNGTTAYTASFYVRMVSRGTISFNNSLTCDLMDATPSGNYLPLLIPNQWVRVSFSAVPTAIATFFFDLLSDNNNNYVLDFWGVQLEAGAFATSYIPTVASSRTRAADNASMTGANFSSWYRQDEGTLVSNFISRGIFGIDGFNRVYDLSDGTSTNGFALLRLGNSNVLFYEAYTYNNVTPFFNTFVTNNSTPILYAAAFRQNYFYRVVKESTGIKTIYNPNFTLTTPSVNRMGIGCEFRTIINRQLNGTISKLTYYPKALTPSQLQALTE